MVIGNFASKDFVAFKLAHDGAGVTNDLTSAFFGRFLFSESPFMKSIVCLKAGAAMSWKSPARVCFCRA